MSQVTHRVTAVYRERLEALRAAIAALPEDNERAAVECAADALSFTIAMGFSPVEEVEIEPRSPGDEVVLDAIDGLLDDSEPMTNAARDNRREENAA